MTVVASKAALVTLRQYSLARLIHSQQQSKPQPLYLSNGFPFALRDTLALIEIQCVQPLSVEESMLCVGGDLSCRILLNHVSLILNELMHPLDSPVDLQNRSTSTL